MFFSQRGVEAADVVGTEPGHGGADQDTFAVVGYKPGSGQGGEVDGAEQGAAALRGGGEPEQVGDRSRSDERRPETPNVGVVEWVVGSGSAGPDGGCDVRSGLSGAALWMEEAFGSARGWRRFHRDGRTNILTEALRRCRNL